MNRVVKFLTLGLRWACSQPSPSSPSPPRINAARAASIIEGNVGGDVATMNPILSGDTASQRVVSLTNIGLLGVDPETAVIAPESTRCAGVKTGMFRPTASLHLPPARLI